MLKLVVMLASGAAAGVASGLLGVGGGVILVPILIYLLKMDAHTAIGTSLLIIVPTALMGAWRHHLDRAVDFRVFAIVSAATILGALVGAHLSLGLAASTLKKVFAVFLFCLSVYMYLKG